MSRKFILCIGIGLMAFASLMPGQTVTGSVSGTVVDSAGAVVTGAQVQLINSISRQARDFTSNSAGDFEFTGIIPGSYSVKVSHGPADDALASTPPSPQSLAETKFPKRVCRDTLYFVAPAR